MRRPRIAVTLVCAASAAAAMGFARSSGAEAADRAAPEGAPALATATIAASVLGGAPWQAEYTARPQLPASSRCYFRDPPDPDPPYLGVTFVRRNGAQTFVPFDGISPHFVRPGTRGLVAVVARAGAFDELRLVSASGRMKTVARVKRYVDVGIADPRWSPDGGALTWALERVRGRDIAWELWLRENGRQRIVHRASMERWPVALWAPDGQRFAFPDNDNVIVMSRKGRRIWSKPGADPLAWSHDGLLAALVPPYEGPPWHIGIFNQEGRRFRTVTADSLAWSPTGQLALARNGSVFIGDRTAAQLKRVAIGAPQNQVPGPRLAWGPKGNTLYYESYRLGTRRINLQGGRTHTERGWPVWSPSNRRTAYIGPNLWINGRRVAIGAGVLIDPAASGWISETTIAYACGRPAAR